MEDDVLSKSSNLSPKDLQYATFYLLQLDLLWVKLNIYFESDMLNFKIFINK